MAEPQMKSSNNESSNDHTSVNLDEHYSKIKQIGKGSMGTVFLVQRNSDLSYFAMKSINVGYHSGITYSRSNSQIQIQREIQILSRLSHPNIVKYYSSFLNTDDCSINLIQEFCDQSTLYSLIKSRRNNNFELLMEQQIINLSVQLASALEYLHANRILHRDFKSQNIFLSSIKHSGNEDTAKNRSYSDYIIKVGDFGISRCLEGSQDLANTCIGTPAYMAPEICHHLPYGSTCDMWSLGCVLVELCCLTPAFQCTGIVVMVFKIINADYAPIPKQYSETLRNLVDSLLRVEPEERPTATQVLDILLKEDTPSFSINSQCFDSTANICDLSKCQIQNRKVFENDFDSFSECSFSETNETLFFDNSTSTIPTTTTVSNNNINNDNNNINNNNNNNDNDNDDDNDNDNDNDNNNNDNNNINNSNNNNINKDYDENLAKHDQLSLTTKVNRQNALKCTQYEIPENCLDSKHQQLIHKKHSLDANLSHAQLMKPDHLEEHNKGFSTSTCIFTSLNNSSDDVNLISASKYENEEICNNEIIKHDIIDNYIDRNTILFSGKVNTNYSSSPDNDEYYSDDFTSCSEPDDS